MNKLFKSFALISIVLLLPLSSMAEDRIRFNFKFGGASGDPSLGAKTLKAKSYAGGSPDLSAAGVADGTLVSSASAEDEKDTQTVGGITIHYVMEMGLVIGLHQHTNTFKTIATQKSAWGTTSTLDAVDAVAAGTKAAVLAGLGNVSDSGTKLGDRESSGYVRFLDIGYLYDMDGFTLAGGVGLPLLGSSSETKVVYTTAGQALNGSVASETIEPDKGKGSALTYFLDFGYTFGSFEATLGYRNVSTKTIATVSKTKGLGKILDDDEFSSEGSHTIYSLGFGYLF